MSPGQASLDAYRPLEEVGRGGMGVVFKGRSKAGEAVAIKIVLRAGSRKQLARFDREKRLLAELGEDAGFVPLLDSGDAPQGPYLVMPFLGGGTLRDRLRRGPLTTEDAVELGVSLALALGRAHAAGIVHRDLKPENVLYTDGGRPLIADLGLAKHFRHDDPDAKSVSLSNPGTAIGTLGYMAPEQMRNAKAAGPEVDVWALGAILYECLSGVRPYRAESALELVRRVTKGGHDPLPAHVPGWLKAIVERTLAPRPTGRFADGAALAAALEAGSGTKRSARGAALPSAVVGGAFVGKARLVKVLVLLPLLGAGLAVAVPWMRKPAERAALQPTGDPVAAVITSGSPTSDSTPTPLVGTPSVDGEKPGKKELALLAEAESAAAAGKKPEAYAAYLDLGARALSREHPRLAVKAYEGALAAATSPEERLAALTHLAFAEMHTASFESSCKHTKRAVALSPDDALLRNNLGYVLHVLGRDDEALEEYRLCLELDSEQHLARMSMGIIARSSGDAKRALKAHKGLLEISKLGALSTGEWFFRFESKESLARGQGVTFATEEERIGLVRLQIALDQAFLDDLDGAETALAAARKTAAGTDDLKPATAKALDDIQLALERTPSRYGLRYLAGILHAMSGSNDRAREELQAFRIREAEHGGRFAEKARELIESLK